MQSTAERRSERAARGRRLRARRRAQAGSIYIETVLIGGVLTTLLAAGGFAFELFSAKLDTLYAARQAAWEGAMPGCSWQSACTTPVRGGAGQSRVQSGFEARWAARLETSTAVSCNEPARDDERLGDVLRTFQTELVKAGPRTVPVIGFTSLLTALQGLAQLGRQALGCVRQALEASPAADALRPLLGGAVERATRGMD